MCACTCVANLCVQRVLTAEWIDGCKVTDKVALTRMGLPYKDVSVYLDWWVGCSSDLVGRALTWWVGCSSDLAGRMFL